MCAYVCLCLCVCVCVCVCVRARDPPCVHVKRNRYRRGEKEGGKRKEREMFLFCGFLLLHYACAVAVWQTL